VNHEVGLVIERESADSEPGADRASLRTVESAFAIGPDEGGKVAKAEPVPVRSEMSVAEAFETIVQSCVRHFRLNEPLVVHRRDPAALHQVRVAMRRLRAAFSLFKPALADPQFEALRQELRWFTGQLGEARNLDVLLQQRGLPRPLRKSLKKERDGAYDQVVEALDSKRLRLLLIDLVAWLELGRWHQNNKAMRPLPDFVARRLYKWWQRIAHHDELRSMRTEERHELRIEIKKLRYGLEFVQPLHVRAEGKQKQFYKGVERIQESLGRLNDLATAQAMSRQFGFKQVPPRDEAHRIEAKCRAAAQTSLDRLKKIGPYWTKLT
jgi:triphosphatase